ncbi:GatB/YqeY domain-containing protein [Candidatus Peregrinibacteria bacterium]|nr:GatB/YqeY domain-containing protein [Candidatus Peregrinibacteria bacterium]
MNSDLLNAMKAKEEIKVGTLRMLKAAVMKFEVSGAEKKDATDDEVIQIIKKEAKQRKDSIDAYTKGGRPEAAAKEEAEMKILESYLPAQMGEDELKAAISRIIGQVGATSKADFGKVMGAVTKELKGKADGQRISKLVGEVLK